MVTNVTLLSQAKEHYRLIAIEIKQMFRRTLSVSSHFIFWPMLVKYTSYSMNIEVQSV